MKKRLSIFILIALFSFNAFSQTSSDPTDPTDPVFCGHINSPGFICEDPDPDSGASAAGNTSSVNEDDGSFGDWLNDLTGFDIF